MSMKIESSENFGLAFNCIIRMYKQKYDERLLILLQRICDEYLIWFSFRVVFCAVRDLLHDKQKTKLRFLPEKQKTGFERLLSRLVKQCITLECQRCENDYTKEEALQELGQQMGLIPGVYEDVRFQSFEEFMEWVREKKLDEPAVYKPNYSGKTIPIKKRFLKDFGKICLLMVQYSLETEAYMRYSCYSLVYHNIRLLDMQSISGIRNYLKNVTSDGDENYWINLKNVLAKETERRKLLEVYQKSYSESWILNGILTGCINKEMLASYEMCREAWWRISVFDEFIKEQKESEKKLQYQKFIHYAREVIGRELKKYDKVTDL